MNGFETWERKTGDSQSVKKGGRKEDGGRSGRWRIARWEPMVIEPLSFLLSEWTNDPVELLEYPVGACDGPWGGLPARRFEDYLRYSGYRLFGMFKRWAM